MRTDNISSIIYLRNKLHTWKNISFLLALFSAFILGKFLFSSDPQISQNTDSIANIKINNIIFTDDYRSKIIKKISENESVKAAIITINSPGGGIVGSEILYNDLKALAKAKPVVVVMESIAASGAYMAAVAADHIIAHNGTLTGSIGVMMQSAEVTDLAQKIGITFNNFKSSPVKGSPSLTEKTSLQTRQIIDDSIGDSHKFFVDLIKNARGDKLKTKLESKIFDGRIFTGRQALEAGLIDQIGTKQDGLDYLAKKKVDITLPIIDVSTIKKKNDFFDKIFGAFSFFKNGSLEGLNHNQQIMAIAR